MSRYHFLCYSRLANLEEISNVFIMNTPDDILMQYSVSTYKTNLYSTPWTPGLILDHLLEHNFWTLVFGLPEI